MDYSILNNKHIRVKLLAFSFLVILLQFVWQGSKGFSLWDEGFLWYGAQRVMAGEVPIRDFMAYDPGRYYWSAALMSVLGDNGIMSLRAAAAVFQALGLFVGLLSIAQSAKNHGKERLLFLIVAAVTLVVWMWPRHKLFDLSISIFLIGILTFLIHNPVPRRYFLAGVCVGLAAVFGRNHGVYGAVGSLGVMLWLTINRASGPNFFRGFMLWSVGVAVGFAPVIAMALFVPGFGRAFWESILFYFELGATNLTVPVPWPWTADFATMPFRDAVTGVLRGSFFIVILVFGVLSISWVVSQRLKEKQVPPVVAAAAFLTFPYAHYAFSRADTEHLTHGMFPLLIGGLAFLATARAWIKWPVALGLCAVSLWAMHGVHPGWECRTGKQCVNTEVSGSKLTVEPEAANKIALLRKLAGQYAPNGESFIAAPFPGAYALLERRAPMWDIYPLVHRSAVFEEEEVARIRAVKPRFAILFDVALDGRDELRLKNTHPLLYRYVVENFEPLPDADQARKIYKFRESSRRE